MRQIKKTAIVGLLFSGLVLLSACKKDVQIFEKKPITEAVEVDASEMERDKFYVKNGTKFSKVYLPGGNAKNEARNLNKARVLYFLNDEPMVPTHYKGEVITYKSATTDLYKEGLTLERYKDIGYSIGVFGGTIGDDGFLHISIKDNVVPGSDASAAFAKSQIDEVRIVSIGGMATKDIVDADCGVLLGLEKDKSYTVEFYLGTYYYQYTFVADTHFLQAYEYYSYGSAEIKDTKLSYMSFTTPTDLKSGYYNVSGTGVFLYHAYEKGNVPEDENLNESYYQNERDQILQFTRQYNLSVPIETKDMYVEVTYGGVSDDEDVGYNIGGYLISPEGDLYDMTISAEQSTMTASLTTAMPGDWTICIFPRSLQISKLTTDTNEPTEEATQIEEEYVVEEGKDYVAVYADITGDGDVYGAIVAEDGRTYVMETVTEKTSDKQKHRYLVYRFPHINAGNYKIVFYYFKSESDVTNISIREYDPTTNELK